MKHGVVRRLGLLAPIAFLATSACHQTTAPQRLVSPVHMTAAFGTPTEPHDVTIDVTIRNTSRAPIHYFGLGACSIPEIEFLDAQGKRVPSIDPRAIVIDMPCGPDVLYGHESLQRSARFPDVFYDIEGNPYAAPAGRYTAVLTFHWWPDVPTGPQRVERLRLSFDWVGRPRQLAHRASRE